MAKQGQFTKEELALVGDALEAYKSEIGKVYKKAEKLGLEQAESLKQTFLEVEALRSKIVTE